MKYLDILKKIQDIDDNIYRNGKDWEIWSGIFNRSLRESLKKNNSTRGKYIFSYWQIQNKIKRDPKLKKKHKENLEEIKKILINFNNRNTKERYE